MSNEVKTIYTAGYGLLSGTHEERKLSFQKRLEYIQRGIGKPITLVDIRKEGCGSWNGKWFRQSSGLVDIEPSMRYLVRFLDSIEHMAEPDLFNSYGPAKWQLEKYSTTIDQSLILLDDYLEPMREAFLQVKAVAEWRERVVVLLCGCKDAYMYDVKLRRCRGRAKCHRVPLAAALVKELGAEWEVCHL